jgi:hypothetical protein
MPAIVNENISANTNAQADRELEERIRSYTLKEPTVKPTTAA